MRPRHAAVLGLGLLSIALGTWSLLASRRQREEGKKALFLSEIAMARIARRKPEPPPPTAEEAETAAMYERAAAMFRPDLVTDEFQAEQQSLPWTGPQPAAAVFVEGHAAMVALLEEAAARRSCRFADDGILRRTKVYRFPTLLEAKGHLEVQRGDFAAAARTVTLFRRVAADLGRIPLNFEYGWFRVVIGLADEHAAEILIAIATAPGLDGEAAAAALAASSGPWEGSAKFLSDADEFEEYFDVNCERALGSGDLARIDGTWWDMVGGDGESKDTAAGGNGEGAGHVLRVPTVEQLRVHRAALILRNSIDPRWEAAARAVDGRWREAFTSSPVRNGVPGSLEHPPPWFRVMMKRRARIAVARTAIALRMFQLREGRAPASLDQLVPGTVAEVPVDPFDGKPLFYEVVGEGGWTVRSRAWPEESLNEDGEPEPPIFVEVKFPRPPR